MLIARSLHACCSCSFAIKHRDRDAAFAIIVKRWIAMTAKSRNPTVRQRVDFLGPLNKWLEPVFMAPSHRFLN